MYVTELSTLPTDSMESNSANWTICLCLIPMHRPLNAQTRTDRHWVLSILISSLATANGEAHGVVPIVLKVMMTTDTRLFPSSPSYVTSPNPLPAHRPC